MDEVNAENLMGVIANEHGSEVRDNVFLNRRLVTISNERVLSERHGQQVKQVYLGRYSNTYILLLSRYQSIFDGFPSNCA
jgi:hypothetical protein